MQNKPSLVVMLFVMLVMPGLLNVTALEQQTGAGCPSEMANIDNQYCIDRWEASVVDKTTGQSASPYYNPVIQKGYLSASWQYASYKNRISPVELPELPEFEKDQAYFPIAVSVPGVYPQGFMNRYSANIACNNAGKRLCSYAEWFKACVGPDGPKFTSKDAVPRYFPFGPKFEKGLCNVNIFPAGAFDLVKGDTSHMQQPQLGLAEYNGQRLLAKSGQFQQCTNEYGVFDMFGNQDEVVSDDGNKPSNMLFVGQYYSRSRRSSLGCGERIGVHADRDYYDYSIGFRCCASIGSQTVPSPVGVAPVVPGLPPGIKPPPAVPLAAVCPPGYTVKPAVAATASAPKPGKTVVPAGFKPASSSPSPVEVIPGTGGCPEGMVAINDKVCIDLFEGSLVRPDGSAFPYYENPGQQISSLKARSVKNVKPQGYISGLQAEQACSNAGKRLCSESEWFTACTGGNPGQAFPYGPTRIDGACNDEKRERVDPLTLVFGPQHGYGKEIQDPRVNQQPNSLAETGSSQKCVSPIGAFDMVGNLHEWISTRVESGKRKGNGMFKGGYYKDTHINRDGCFYTTTAHDPKHWDYSTGFRCCKDKGGGVLSPSGTGLPSINSPPPSVTGAVVLNTGASPQETPQKINTIPKYAKYADAYAGSNNLITGMVPIGAAASPKLALKQIAEQEYARWGNGAKKESDVDMKSVVEMYFAAGGCAGANPVVTPWSAAFISWVAEQAGISDFPANCAHTQYFSKIQKNLGTCTAHPMSEKNSIEVGDIICACRYDEQRDAGKASCRIDYDNVYGLSHCDIVVSREPLNAIGGNVNNNVDLKKNMDINDNKYFGFLSCGPPGQFPGAPSTIPASAQAAAPAGPTCPAGSIAVVGDSITVGFGGRNTYPAMFEDKLKEACPSVKVQSEDSDASTTQGIPKAGQPHDKYAYVGKHVPTMKADFDSVLLGSHSDIVIMGGINDLAGGAGAQKIQEGLADMYARAKAKGMRVIALTTTPWKGYGTATSVGWTEKKYVEQQELNNWILSKPANVDVAVDVFAALDDPANSGAMRPEAGSVDKIHPGINGLHLIADAIFAAAYAQGAAPAVSGASVAAAQSVQPQCVPAPLSSIYDFVVISQSGVTNVLGIARQNLAVGVVRKEPVAPPALGAPSTPTSGEPSEVIQATLGPAASETCNFIPRTVSFNTEKYKALYGSSEQSVNAQLETITFRGKKVAVHSKIKNLFPCIEAEIEECAEGKAYEVRMIGAFKWRPIRGKENAPEQLSMHSFATAIDINWDTNPMRDDGILQTDMPKCFVDAFKKFGFSWGGDWGKRKDAMHF
ncbi:DUF2272 domain-containing protein [Candidatus Woesearchaeota archaeon]|nr:DUF2272 domain-containing protein [Candidatus Woesearchaeota archaeon]